MHACRLNISNKFVYSISLSTNSPDEGPLLKTLRIEYFYLFQIVVSKNPSLGVVLMYNGMGYLEVQGYLTLFLIMPSTKKNTSNFVGLFIIFFICLKQK